MATQHDGCWYRRKPRVLWGPAEGLAEPEGIWRSCSEADSRRMNRCLTRKEQGCGACLQSEWPTAGHGADQPGGLRRKDYGGRPEPAKKHRFAILGREPLTFKKVAPAVVWLMARWLLRQREQTSFCDFLDREWKAGPDESLGSLECQPHDDSDLNSVLFRHILSA